MTFSISLRGLVVREALCTLPTSCHREVRLLLVVWLGGLDQAREGQATRPCCVTLHRRNASSRRPVQSSRVLCGQVPRRPAGLPAVKSVVQSVCLRWGQHSPEFGDRDAW